MTDLPIVFHPLYEIETRDESRFPMRKYKELRYTLEREGLLKKQNLFVQNKIYLFKS